MYSAGRGVERDVAESTRLYRRAAERGDTNGMVNLSLAYSQGWGVAVDYAQAIRWSRAAAEKGDPVAMNSVGYALLEGHGVERDVAAAVPWLQRAAEFGQPNAMHTMGSLFFSGTGVQRDLVESYKWLHLATDHYGSTETARRESARLMMLAISKELSEAELAEALRRIQDWRPRERPSPDEQAPPRHAPMRPPKLDST
jgi:TPR repeat protein